MVFLYFFIGAAALYAITWSIYLLALPLLASFRGSVHGNRGMGSRSRNPRISVVIPAHDMEPYIERCILSLKACDYVRESLDIYVVADHCSDRTAILATEADAIVLARSEQPPGKTFALAWAFDELKTGGLNSDLYVIVDATAYVAAGFLANLAKRWSLGEDVIMAHTLVDPSNQKWFARCLGLTLAHRNLQDESRDRLSLSALVCGRGMAFGHTYIAKHGWNLALPSETGAGAHPTEDFRHGVRLAEHGYQVAFANDAHVFTPLRHSLGAATRQNVRWEKGRIGNASTHARRLLSQSIKERHTRKFVSAADAMQPPVAILIAFSLAVAAIALLYLPAGVMQFLALLPFMLVFVYGVLVLRQGQREGIEAHTVLWAPVYIAWRASAFLGAVVGVDRLFDGHAKRPSRHD